MNRTTLLPALVAVSLVLNVVLGGIALGRSLLDDEEEPGTQELAILHLQGLDVTEMRMREYYLQLRGGLIGDLDFLSTCNDLQVLSTEARIEHLDQARLANVVFQIDNPEQGRQRLGVPRPGQELNPASQRRALELLMAECELAARVGPEPVPPQPSAEEFCSRPPEPLFGRPPTQPPSHPYLAAALYIGPSRTLVVEGDYAYVSADSGCILAVNISDPARPRVAGATRTDPNGQVSYMPGTNCVPERDRDTFPPKPCAVPFYSDASSLRIAGDTLYAGSYTGLQIFDISDRTSPEFVRVAGDRTGHIDIEGDRLYAGGLSIYDISDRRNPRLITHHQVEGYGGFVEADGGFVYLRSDNNMYDGVRIVDARTPESPAVVGLIDAEGPGDKPHHAVADRIAYWLVNDFLTVADMSDPSAPVVVATMPIPAEAERAFYADGLLYARVGPGVDQGLMVIDVTTPTAPVLRGTVRIGAAASGLGTIAAAGDHAFVLAADHFQVIDVGRLLRDSGP